LGVQRLEAKRVNGHTYYYLSNWGWREGKCRRFAQQYLGKLEDFSARLTGAGPAPAYAEVFELGRPLALWEAVQRSELIPLADELCPKRHQGLSSGTYLALAAVNRAAQPVSKRGFWDWLAGTALVRAVPEVCAEALSSQRFWDHLERWDPEKVQVLWKGLLQRAVQREGIDLSRLCYDGTNFYTFIDTFNVQNHVAQRGKNKQGRANLRQVSYALVCAAHGQWPLYYEVYEGNRNDSRQFGEMLGRFAAFYAGLAPAGTPWPKTTLVFDKGNNSAANFALIDALGLDYVGAVKLGEVAEWAAVSNTGDARWEACAGLEGTKAFRVESEVYGRKRALVVSWHQGLFEAQWATVQSELARALRKLGELEQSLERRQQGEVKGGKAPTVESVQKQCREILHREHLSQVVASEVRGRDSGVPELNYRVEPEALERLRDTVLGKNVLVTSHEGWSNGQVVEAYRSQFLIEEMFQQMKDRDVGCWWPMFHWTDRMIQVHGLYCTIALLLRAMVGRQVREAGVELPLTRLWAELEQVREVVNVYEGRGARKLPVRQTVQSKQTALQERLVEVLGLRGKKPAV
jgi:transposase